MHTNTFGLSKQTPRSNRIQLQLCTSVGIKVRLSFIILQNSLLSADCTVYVISVGYKLQVSDCRHVCNYLETFHIQRAGILIIYLRVKTDLQMYTLFIFVLISPVHVSVVKPSSSSSSLLQRFGRICELSQTGT
jgi:hypothetical protein